jgi:hypothetical protein
MTIEELVKDVLKNPDNLFKSLGTAFRPDLRHFTDLSEEEQEGRLREVPILKKNHDDWPAPFNTIPRSATVFFGPPPASGSKPILPPGESFVGEGYLTLTTDDGIHIRHGFRYDDIDHYYTYVILTIKRVSEDGEGILGQILDYADTALFVAAMFFPKLKAGAAILSLINGLEEVYQKLPDVDPLLLKTQKRYKEPTSTRSSTRRVINPRSNPHKKDE